ncbi:Uncharacterised protein [Sphingobacterium daejeonense]|nr:Uncharacterised protein [Sphingobacterium daejeonense]
MKIHAKASTFAICTSQLHNSKIAKELALPTQHNRPKMSEQPTLIEDGRTANKVLPKVGAKVLNTKFVLL